MIYNTLNKYCVLCDVVIDMHLMLILLPRRLRDRGFRK